LNDLISKTVLR